MLREASPKAKLLQSSFHFEIILLRNLNFHGWRTVSRKRFSKQLVRPAHSNRGKPLHFALKKDKGSRLAYTTTLWIEYYSLFGQFNIYPATSGCTIENLGIKYPLDLGKELFIRFICPRNFPLRCLTRPVKISFNMSSDRRSFSHFRNLCKNFIPFSENRKNVPLPSSSRCRFVLLRLPRVAQALEEKMRPRSKSNRKRDFVVSCYVFCYGIQSSLKFYI